MSALGYCSYAEIWNVEHYLTLAHFRLQWKSASETGIVSYVRQSLFHLRTFQNAAWRANRFATLFRQSYVPPFLITGFLPDLIKKNHRANQVRVHLWGDDIPTSIITRLDSRTTTYHTGKNQSHVSYPAARKGFNPCTSCRTPGNQASRTRRQTSGPPP